MLNELKRFFKAVDKEPQMANVEKDVTDAVVVTAESFVAESAVNVAKLEDMEGFQAISAELADMKAKYTEVLASLELMKLAKADSDQAIKASLMTARKTKLEAILGTIKAPAVYASLEQLDEATFHSVADAMAASYKTEDNSEMFTEAGVDGTVKAVASTDETKEMKLIKAQLAAMSAN